MGRQTACIILGLDPGLQRTGWGLIRASGNHLTHLRHGTIATDPASPVAARLALLAGKLCHLIAETRPDLAAVEEVYVNRNPQSSIKLGMARGVALLVPAQAGLPVHEYAPSLVKKALVGKGGAAKEQVQMMVATLLPGSEGAPADAADALAVAICHAHHALANGLRVA